MTITVTDGTTVVVTEDHPFYVDDEGWILSGDLRIGDHLAQRNHTTTTITTITRTQRVVTVYNYEATGDVSSSRAKIRSILKRIGRWYAWYASN